jgi:hypothetical protein
VVETGVANKNWRLCAASEEEEVADELVFRVQGILVKNNLIPRNLERHGLPIQSELAPTDYLRQFAVQEESIRVAVH